MEREQLAFIFLQFLFGFQQNSVRHNVYLVHEKACNAITFSETFRLKIDIWVRCGAMNERTISAIFWERKTL